MSHADEYHDASQVRIPCSRGKVRCSVCRESIPAGIHYVRHWSIYDGNHSNTAHCARCWAIWEAIVAESDGPVCVDLDCGESWEDVFGTVPEHVAALAFALSGEVKVPLPSHIHGRFWLDGDRLGQHAAGCCNPQPLTAFAALLGARPRAQTDPNGRGPCYILTARQRRSAAQFQAVEVLGDSCA